MTQACVVTGTDTGIGKTWFAAALTRALDGYYWKPVQAGLEEETDSQAVARLGGITAARIIPEAYRLKTPASPHLSARLDRVAVEPERLILPETDHPLVVEGAGGLLVPLTDRLLFVDIFARWQIPVILCARTTLGTINHTLLSLEALKRRAVPILGVAFIGEENDETQRVIVKIGAIRSLGCLPWLSVPTPKTLQKAFDGNIDIEHIKAALA
ncbi:dithiobiotin synthase (plasmid) [Rhizobium etli 8C-3]|uniref:ATP-dependent dethiobiotin synthetase BioD n=2 Tax=Rhizobium TaxID=379 RepID=A0A4R3QU80_9HYPH|nr:MULTISPECIES: dethiobiotin synthase [Rhizobium]APO78460.1 dithiobiotin synthase [Rhizobium etli 8C-3]TCU24749.1 dethiobiotin synthase [Rhizobium azibense]TCU39495.1 dethiobiotin synthase [Rhizobium azibense]